MNTYLSCPQAAQKARMKKISIRTSSKSPSRSTRLTRLDLKILERPGRILNKEHTLRHTKKFTPVSPSAPPLTH